MMDTYCRYDGCVLCVGYLLYDGYLLSAGAESMSICDSITVSEGVRIFKRHNNYGLFGTTTFYPFFL